MTFEQSSLVTSNLVVQPGRSVKIPDNPVVPLDKFVKIPDNPVVPLDKFVKIPDNPVVPLPDKSEFDHVIRHAKMATNQDKVHDDSLKIEISISQLSQELKESVGTEEDVRRLNIQINRQLDDLRSKIQVNPCKYIPTTVATSRRSSHSLWCECGRWALP